MKAKFISPDLNNICLRISGNSRWNYLPAKIVTLVKKTVNGKRDREEVPRKR